MKGKVIGLPNPRIKANFQRPKAVRVNLTLGHVRATIAVDITCRLEFDSWLKTPTRFRNVTFLLVSLDCKCWLMTSKSSLPMTMKSESFSRVTVAVCRALEAWRAFSPKLWWAVRRATTEDCPVWGLIVEHVTTPSRIMKNSRPSSPYKMDERSIRDGESGLGNSGKGNVENLWPSFSEKMDAHNKWSMQVLD
jgi:hypothetical protein